MYLDCFKHLVVVIVEILNRRLTEDAQTVVMLVGNICNILYMLVNECKCSSVYILDLCIFCVTSCPGSSS